MELKPLPYAPDALAPAISAETLAFHHGKHLQAYINNLNALLPGSGLEGLPLEEIVVRSEGGLRNNAGQVLNHEMYFSQFRPPVADNRPTGELAERLDAAGSGSAPMKRAAWSLRRKRTQPIPCRKACVRS